MSAAERYPDGVRLSPHALDVMRARDVEPEEIAEALSSPEVTEPHKGRRRFIRGPLSVVVAESPDGRRAVVVTVLLRRRASWHDADVRTRTTDR